MPDPHATTAQKIVDLLHAERTRLGWSQETLAVAAGVSNSCIRHLEHGRATPTLVTVLKLADALGLDVVVLVKNARSAASDRGTAARRRLT